MLLARAGPRAKTSGSRGRWRFSLGRRTRQAPNLGTQIDTVASRGTSISQQNVLLGGEPKSKRYCLMTQTRANVRVVVCAAAVAFHALGVCKQDTFALRHMERQGRTQTNRAARSWGKPSWSSVHPKSNDRDRALKRFIGCAPRRERKPFRAIRRMRAVSGRLCE